MTDGFSQKISPRTRHDELFKELIDTFTYPFLELFFPWLANELERESLKQVGTELIDSEDLSSRHADLVYEVKLKDGEEIILHIEGQNQLVANYIRKVLAYNFRLFEKHDKKVISIVVYGHDGKQEELDSLHLSFLDLTIMLFNYLRVQLQKESWQDYQDCSNPVAAAFLSKMTFANAEKVEVKLAHMKILARLDLSPEETRLVITYFDTYLKLTPDEKEVFNQQLKENLSAEEAIRMTQYLTSYHEDGMAIGFEMGRKEGIEEGIKEGIEAGIKEGIEAGRSEGKNQGLREVAANLLRLGKLSVEEIVLVTGLTRQEFEQLRI